MKSGRDIVVERLAAQYVFGFSVAVCGCVALRGGVNSPATHFRRFPAQPLGSPRDDSLQPALQRIRACTQSDQMSAPTASEQLCPPKPKLFDSARRTRISRGWFGTQSRSHAGSGFV